MKKWRRNKKAFVFIWPTESKLKTGKNVESSVNAGFCILLSIIWYQNYFLSNAKVLKVKFFNRKPSRILCYDGRILWGKIDYWWKNAVDFENCTFVFAYFLTSEYDINLLISSVNGTHLFKTRNLKIRSQCWTLKLQTRTFRLLEGLITIVHIDGFWVDWDILLLNSSDFQCAYIDLEIQGLLDKIYTCASFPKSPRKWPLTTSLKYCCVGTSFSQDQIKGSYVNLILLGPYFTWSSCLPSFKTGGDWEGWKCDVTWVAIF